MHQRQAEDVFVEVAGFLRARQRQAKWCRPRTAGQARRRGTGRAGSCGSPAIREWTGRTARVRRHHFIDGGLAVAVAQGFDQQQHQLRQAVALDRGVGRAGERDQAFEQIVAAAATGAWAWAPAFDGECASGDAGGRRGRARRRSSPAGRRRPGPRRRHRRRPSHAGPVGSARLRRSSPRPAGAAAPRGPRRRNGRRPSRDAAGRRRRPAPGCPVRGRRRPGR